MRRLSVLGIAALIASPALAADAPIITGHDLNNGLLGAKRSFMGGIWQTGLMPPEGMVAHAKNLVCKTAVYSTVKECFVAIAADLDQIPKGTMITAKLPLGASRFAVETTVDGQPLKIKGCFRGNRQQVAKGHCELEIENIKLGKGRKSFNSGRLVPIKLSVLDTHPIAQRPNFSERGPSRSPIGRNLGVPHR